MYILLFLSFFLCNNGFLLKQQTRFKSNLMMNHYEHAEEYYDFYTKYKQPILTGNNHLVNYEEFAKQHNTSYSIFQKNMLLIRNTNEDLRNKESDLVLGENQFMDTIDFDDEIRKNSMLTNIRSPCLHRGNYKNIIKRPLQYLETMLKNSLLRFSWKETGLLSPVKNQESCGSCWAFSTTSSLETFMRKHNYSIERLSEQELVDCSEKNEGCNGGLMNLAYDYIIERGGLSSNENYPYISNKNDFCSQNVPREIGSNITEYSYIIPESIDHMKYSVLQNPVAIALDADNIYFRFYKDGVIDLPVNASHSLNHAVLLVGYDHDDKGMYWIIQNSWGTQWGDQGFCKLRVRPKEGTLLCQLYGLYPTK
jgi:C1A family cysteine protease